MHKCNINNTCTFRYNEMMANSKRTFMTVEEALEALFQNNFADCDSNSPAYDIHESDSDISIKSDYNEKSIVPMFITVSFPNLSLGD